MPQEKSKPELPEFLRDLDRVDFVRKPAPTGKELLQERVIYDVNSLDALFHKAKRLGLLPDPQKPILIRAPSRADSQHPAFSGDDQGFLSAPGGQEDPPSSQVQPKDEQPPHPTINPSGVVHGDPITVRVDPSSVTLQPRGTRQFSAKVFGSPNSEVIWQIDPPDPSAGTISQSGYYVAPSATPEKAITITAYSAADRTKSGKASVTVSS
jgi:hypothetical protein